jgi:hypothetical protein
MSRSLPTPDRPALRSLLTTQNAGLLGLIAVLATAAILYGSLLIAIEALIIAGIAGFVLVEHYRLTVDQAARSAELAVSDARLAEQAATVKAAVDALPSMEKLTRDAVDFLQARRDLVALGMACPESCTGCDVERREGEARDREFCTTRPRQVSHH